MGFLWFAAGLFCGIFGIGIVVKINICEIEKKAFKKGEEYGYFRGLSKRGKGIVEVEE